MKDGFGRDLLERFDEINAERRSDAVAAEAAALVDQVAQ